MRRTILVGVVGLLAIAGVFLGVVGLLNATVFSASGFVSAYLDALARRDAVTALELAGPPPEADDAANDLLARAGMPGLDGIRITDDVAVDGTTHRVTAEWTSLGQPGRSTFVVEQSGSWAGVFPRWRFAESPIATVSIVVLHDDRFTVNGLDLVTPAQNAAAPYFAFTPGTYELTHATAYLAAERERIVAVATTGDDGPLTATLDIQPTDAFVAAAQAEVDAALDDCATQEVLMPTGCPFGQSMANRIASTPEWSIVSYPEVAIVPGLQASQWEIPATDGVAHLRVDVRSLFDGTVTPFDNDIPYRVGFVLTLGRDDTITLSPQYASG